MKYFLLITFGFVSLFSRAAFIDGPANVRQTPNGKLLFTVADSQYVYANEPEDGWFKIMLLARIKKVDLKNNFILKADSKIYDIDGSIIGVVKNDLEIKGNHIKVKDTSVLEVMFHGFTFKGNIRPESILEREVERIVNNEQFEEVPTLLTRFNFTAFEIGEYHVYTKYDASDPWLSADFRMMIYCDNKNNLIGVANIGRELKLNNKMETTIDRGYRMQYIMLLENSERKEFEELMTNYFSSRD